MATDEGNGLVKRDIMDSVARVHDSYAARCTRCGAILASDSLGEWARLQLDHQNSHRTEDGNPLFELVF